MKLLSKFFVFLFLSFLGFNSAFAAILCPKTVTCKSSNDCPGYIYNTWEITMGQDVSAGTYYLTGAIIEPTYAECVYRTRTTTSWLVYSTQLPLKADTTPMLGRLWKTDEAGLNGTCMSSSGMHTEISPEQCPFINKK